MGNQADNAEQPNSAEPAHPRPSRIGKVGLFLGLLPTTGTLLQLLLQPG
jgi:hypothetical protein